MVWYVVMIERLGYSQLIFCFLGNDSNDVNQNSWIFLQEFLFQLIE